MSSSPKIDVSLIIPVHERTSELCTLLDSLNQLNGRERLEIIVVDDGSSKSLEPAIRAKNYHWPITFLRNEQAKGPSAARNRGAKSARGGYLWFLDSDSEICSPETLAALTERLEALQVGAVGGVYEPFAESGWKPVRLLLWPNFLFVYLLGKTAEETAGIVGGLGSCNLMVRKDDFESVAGFDETLRRDEDVDLCLKLSSRGLVIEQVSRGLVRHHLSSSGRETGQLAHFKSPRDYFKDMLGTRAKLLARYRPMRAALLPILDAVFFPLMALQVFMKRYSTNRMSKMAATSRVEWALALINEMFSSYITAWKELGNRKGHKIYAQPVSV